MLVFLTGSGFFQDSGSVRVSGRVRVQNLKLGSIWVGSGLNNGSLGSGPHQIPTHTVRVGIGSGSPEFYPNFLGIVKLSLCEVVSTSSRNTVSDEDANYVVMKNLAKMIFVPIFRINLTISQTDTTYRMSVS